MDKSTAQTIASFISSHRKAIANIAKKHTAAAASVGLISIVQLIRGCNINSKATERMQARQRKDMLETDGRKEQRWIRQIPSIQQKSMSAFI